MSDPAERLREERRARLRPALEIALAGKRADGQNAAGLGETVEVVAAVDVHERRRASQAQRQHGDEALAARQDLGLVTVASQCLDGVGRARCGNVLEGRRLHFLAADSRRPMTTEGPRGVRVTRAPKGASASSTALAMAAGGEIAPPSPTPFMPSVFLGVGYSRGSV